MHNWWGCSTFSLLFHSFCFVQPAFVLFVCGLRSPLFCHTQSNMKRLHTMHIVSICSDIFEANNNVLSSHTNVTIFMIMMCAVCELVLFSNREYNSSKCACFFVVSSTVGVVGVVWRAFKVNTYLLKHQKRQLRFAFSRIKCRVKRGIVKSERKRKRESVELKRHKLKWPSEVTWGDG